MPIQTGILSFDRFLRSLRQEQKRLSILKVTQWSIRDGKKAEDMVEKVKALISDLWEMIDDFRWQQHHEEVLGAELATIRDTGHVEKIQQILLPVRSDETGHLATAPGRQPLLEQQDTQITLQSVFNRLNRSRRRVFASIKGFVLREPAAQHLPGSHMGKLLSTVAPGLWPSYTRSYNRSNGSRNNFSTEEPT